MSNRTYIDANVLRAAFKGQNSIGIRALAIVDDPDRTLVVSDAVWLEVMPKPLYEHQNPESRYYQAIFETAEYQSWQISVLHQAHDLAKTYGMAAMDAIHIATAVAAQVDEFVSCEKSTKPMFRARLILAMRSLRE